MATTYVYCSTDVDASVSLSLSRLGPNRHFTGLKTNSLPSKTTDAEIMAIYRRLDPGIYIGDTAFSIDGTYIASAQIMLIGPEFGSSIWWRWRKASPDIGTWYTDYARHSTLINARGKQYTFTITGVSAVGYSDLNISLTA